MNIGEAWTHERVRALTKLWADGMSASKIAAELGGCTRSSVIGKVHRLMLPGRKTIERKPAYIPVGRPKRSAPFKPVVQDAPVIIDIPSDQSLFACTIHALTDAMCRWPLGEPRHDMQYCGEPTARIFCDRHHRLAHRRNADTDSRGR